MTDRLRWAGLAGAVLVAAGAYLAGAGPGRAPATRSAALWGAGAGFRLGLLAYLAGLLLLGWAWWRIAGSYPDRGPRLRWVWLTGALWMVPLLAAPPLGSRDVYAYACQGAVWLDGYDPYTVGAAGGGCRWLESVPSLWHDTPAPYGPLGLLVSAAAVWLARLVASGESAQLLVAVGALRAVAVLGVALVAGFLPRLARACGVDPAAAGWLGLVTPLVGVHLVSGAHHDALVTGLVVAGLALAAPTPPAPSAPSTRPEGRMIGAGVMLGLAVALKVTAVAAAPFALLLAVAAARSGAGNPPPTRPGWAGSDHAPRNAGHSRTQDRSPANQVGSPTNQVGRAVLAAALMLAAVGTFAGLTVATGLGLGWVRALTDTGSIGQWSSLPTGLGMALGYALWGLGMPTAFDGAVAVARWLGLGALVAVSVALLWRAWRRVRPAPDGRLAHVAGPAREIRPVVLACGAVLAAVVVLGPVVYPWYAAGALAVLAASVPDPRARRWLAMVTLGFTALTLPSGLGVPVLTRLPGALFTAVLAGWALWWWLRRRARRPGRPASAA